MGQDGCQFTVAVLWVLSYILYGGCMFFLTSSMVDMSSLSQAVQACSWTGN